LLCNEIHKGFWPREVSFGDLPTNVGSFKMKFPVCGS